MQLKKRGRIRKALAFFTSATLAKAWAVWQQGVKIRKSSRSRAETAIQFLRHSTVAKTFYGWADTTRLRVSRRERMHGHMQRIVHQTTFKAWGAWVDFVVYQDAKRKAQAVWTKSVMHRAWSALVYRLQMRHLVSRGTNILVHRQTLRAWNAWMDAHNDLRDRTTLASSMQTRALSRMSQGLLSRGFMALLDYKNRMEAARRLMNRIVRNNVSRAFQGWKARVCNPRGGKGASVEVCGQTL
eukprot:jgi/Botrbrau1/16989/Bobra.49_2s0048.1